ncbi:flippase [Patescibacteria group bacterium]|nr:flippase [Patescibacteria group bacterium]
MSNTSKIAFNTAIQLVGKAVTVATSIVIVAYLTRYLGVAGYGDYATIFAYLGIFGVVVDLGLFVIGVREIAKHPDQEATILSNMLGLKIVFGLAIFALAYGITWGLPYSHVIRQGILLGAVSQFFISLNQVPLGSFQANLVMYKATISDVIARFLMLGLVWWFVGHNGTVLDMVLTVVAANIVAFGMNILLMRANYWLRPEFNLKEWGKIIKEALPMGIIMVLGAIYFRIDTLMLAGIKGSEAVGIYSAPYKILEVLLVVPSIFMSSVLPVITAAMNRSVADAQIIFQKAFNFLSITALPLVAGTVIASTQIMLLIAGGDFVASGPLLKILVIALGGSFINSVMIYTMIAADQQKQLLVPYLGATIFNIVANLIVIPHYSYWGAALVTVVTEIWVLLASGYLVLRKLKFKIKWRVFGLAFLSSVVMSGGLYFIRTENLIWLVVVGGVIYSSMMLLTKAVTKQELLEMLPKGIK